MFSNTGAVLGKLVGRIDGIVLLLILSVPAYADEGINRIYEQLKPSVSDLTLESISESTVSGLYEIRLGFDVYHVTADGQYLISGDIIELTSGKRVVGSGLDAKRQRMIASVDESDMVIYPAKVAPKATITIFTDPTCPYCQKLHSEVNLLTEAGITVRYLAYPRSGIPSDGAEQLTAVWCSVDRLSAMTKVKQGESISAPACDSPVEEHYRLGVGMGLKGTPSIVLMDGTLIGGYMPAEKLISNAIAAMP